MFIGQPLPGGQNSELEKRKRALLERLSAGRGGRRNVAGGLKNQNSIRGRGAPMSALGSAAGRFNRPFGGGGVHPGLAGLSVAQENIPPEFLPPQLGGMGGGPPMGPAQSSGNITATPSADIGTMQGYGGAPEWFDIMRNYTANHPFQLGRYNAY
jgi:hypothetical protein